MVIWKYMISVHSGVQIIEMPEQSEVLSFQAQNGTPTIWCLINENTPLIHKRFIIFGTGWNFNIPDGKELKYIGTVQEKDSAGFTLYVWHLFEEVLIDKDIKF